MNYRQPIAVLLLLTMAISTRSEIISFGEGDNQFELEFVPIGSPGNPDDTRVDYDFGDTNIGGVGYEYGISKFEVTCEAMTIVSGEGALFHDEPQEICRLRDRPNQPGRLEINNAYAFVNWLNESQGYSPAYRVAPRLVDWDPSDPGYDPDNPTRNSNARFFIPTADEFHKAAYYDPATGEYLDYATGSNVEPTPVRGGTDPNTLVIGRTLSEGRFADVVNAGGLSAFGTMGQVGNATEWEEDFLYYSAGVQQSLGRGFSFSDTRIRDPLGGGRGFRIVSIPEPSGHVLLLIALVCCVSIPSKRR